MGVVFESASIPVPGQAVDRYNAFDPITATGLNSQPQYPFLLLFLLPVAAPPTPGGTHVRRNMPTRTWASTGRPRLRTGTAGAFAGCMVLGGVGGVDVT